MAKLPNSPRTQAPLKPNRAARRAAAGQRRYITINQAADYLQVTDRTIRQMIADGRLRAYRGGSRLIRLDLNEIDAAMQPFGGAV